MALVEDTVSVSAQDQGSKRCHETEGDLRSPKSLKSSCDLGEGSQD